MISFDEERTYYDVLEVTPDASPQDIRNAYLRAKSAYKKDSVALYSLMSEAETEGLLKEIEEAFLVLSNPERRRDYDRRHGILKLDSQPAPQPAAGAKAPAAGSSNVISIDRVPPMDSVGGGDELLIAPATDFADDARATSGARGIFDSGETPLSGGARAGSSSSSAGAAPAPRAATPLTAAVPSSRGASPGGAASAALQQEIDEQTEWSGAFLKRVREGRQIAIEELADYTKISKTYLLAIENEDFTKLPAAVFLRGFVTQVAKYMKLPHDKVVAAYMNRYSRFQSQKTGTGGR